MSASYGGNVYHSRLEALYAAHLDMLKKASDPRERVVRWERQVKVALIVNGKLVTTYYCDFRVWYADGRDAWIEVKGFETNEWRIKRNLFEALFPERDLRVIKNF